MRSLLLLLPLLWAGCTHTRPDDALEPNNTGEQATPLTPGTPVQGRANQGNPDVFALEVPAGKAAVVFRLESLGLEDCAAFTITGPGAQVLYDDGRFRNCQRPASPPVAVAGARLSSLGGGAQGYELRAPATQAGRYFLTILEQGQADNSFLFSWDYRLTALLE